MASWARTSVAIVTFGFVNLVLFIVLSTPIGNIFGLVEDQADEMGISGDVDPIINMWRTVFGFTFVASMIGLIVWFFLGSHEEEYEEYSLNDQWQRRY
jgi:hypothetical protein